VLTWLRTRTAAVLVVLAAMLGGAVVVAAPAAADPPPGCTVVQVPGPDGKLKFVVTCPGDDDGGSPGGGGDNTPTCTLTGLATYCVGTSACWANVPSALDPSTWPEETRPSPEAIYTFQYCDPDPTGTLTTWSWYEPPGPSLQELAQRAYGRLATPAFTVAFNPPGEAIVGLPTWFWADAATAGEIVGDSALGVVAIGAPDHLEVDPGDGSGTFTCPFAVTSGSDCSHEYTRSSAREPAAHGVPSYTARIRLVYDVRYENAGTRLTIPGLPDTLTSPWVAGAVPVAEVQTLVTSGS